MHAFRLSSSLCTVHSQKRVSQRTSHNADARSYGLSRTFLLQTRVDFDQVQSDQATSLVHALCNEISLSQRKTSSHRRSGTRREPRVERINVERQVNRSVRTDPSKRHIHDLANTMTINVVHAKGLDPMLAQNLLLAAVYVSETNVHELFDTDTVLILDPAERRIGLVGRKTRQESNGHAVNVAAVRSLGGVDVCVRIDPDDSHFAAESLADRFGGAADGADGNAVVAAEREDETAFLGVLVDLLAEGFGDGANGSGLLHATVVWIGGGQELIVGVNFSIEVDVVFEVVFELVCEAGLYEGHGRGIDTGFTLRMLSETSVATTRFAWFDT
jgi:hypothetical protein